MNKEEKRRVRIYEYLVFRKERELEWFIDSMEGTGDDFRQISILTRRITNMEFKLRMVKKNWPINGLSDDFNIQSNGARTEEM
jgi:hypothetical protein